MPHHRTRRPASEFRDIVAERVERLFELAETEFKRKPDLADRYVQLAWRLKTRYNLKLPSHIKRRFCKKCFSFWKPGVSCRVRIRQSQVLITCLRCGHQTRLPFKQKNK